ncbi:hypothetical protein VE00_08234 [Pseudogymnoascus sp. WSF 3629]|nr:hypothetical protein VE00_08234 [Pseudogymnoascus sp. WSF 3629]
MQRYHTTGSTEPFQTAHSPPSSSGPGSSEPELTTQRLSSRTTRPRTPSLSGSDFSESNIGHGHHRTSYHYPPRRHYISSELFILKLIPAYMILSLALWFPEPVTVIPISLAAMAILLWASYEFYKGRPY